MVLLLINSCKKTEEIASFSETQKISVNELRLLYHSKIGSTEKINSDRAAPSDDIDWSHALSLKKLNGSNLLSIPILRNETDVMNGAQRRLVANRNNSNKLDMAIMVVIPDKAYLTAKKGKLTMKDFSGYMMFFDIDNKFRKGHIVSNGKITGEIKVEQYSGTERNSRDKLASLKNGQYSQEFLLQVQSSATYKPTTVQYLVQECEWRQGGYYVDSEGVLNIIAIKHCRTVSVPDPLAPFELEPLPEGEGGNGGGIWVPYDCANIPNGEAYTNQDCNTCMGGTTGITDCPTREIKRDTSITNNAKINCLVEKLLGLDGTVGNAQIKALLTAFTNKGFDVTFKIGTLINNNASAETGAVTNDPTKYNIILNRNKINTESQMNWVKTLLHEAFHANLMQKSYELFGSSEIALWLKKPEEMSIEELMDQIDLKIQGKVQLGILHHEFMAENINTIKNGLKAFSLANNTNHSDFIDDDFKALSYKGLESTSYYINKVCKDANGDIIRLNYSGGNYTLAEVHSNRVGNITVNSVIPCN